MQVNAMKTRLFFLPLLVLALGANAQSPDGRGPLAGLQRITLALQNDTEPKVEVPMEMFGKALVAALGGRGFSLESPDAAGVANCSVSVREFEEKEADGEPGGREFSMRVKVNVARPKSQLSATSSFRTQKRFPAERVEADRAACLEEFIREAAETGAKNLSFGLPPEMRATAPLGDAFAGNNLPGPDGTGAGAVFASMLEGMRKDARFLAHYEAQARKTGRLPLVVPGGIEDPSGGNLAAAAEEGAAGVRKWLSASGLFAVEENGEAIDRARRLLESGPPEERSGDGMPDYFLSGGIRHSAVDGRESWWFSLSLRDFATGRCIWDARNIRDRPR